MSEQKTKRQLAVEQGFLLDRTDPKWLHPLCQPTHW